MGVAETLLAVTLAFTVTLLGGLFSIRYYRRNIGVLGAFTAGMLIALSLFDLFPKVLTLSQTVQMSLESGVATAILGFTILYGADRYLQLPKHKGTHRQNNLRRAVGLFATSEFCSHGFFEGLAIGFSFQLDLHLGAIVAAAVVSHDFCDGIGTVTLMLNSGNSTGDSIIMLLIDAAAPIAGAATTLFLSPENYYMLLLLAFIAGGFIYLGCGNLLPKAYRENARPITLVSFIAGFTLISLI